MQDGRIRGTFKNINNDKTYWIQIGEFGPVLDIKDGIDDVISGNTICWGTDPITITSQMDDTFEHVYVRSCEINLVANFDVRNYIVAENIYDLPVEIRYNNSEGQIIFSGFVTPLSFNQNFAEKWNEFTVNCIDKLGILEYVKFPPLLSSQDYQTPWNLIYAALQQNELNISVISASGLDYNHLQDTKINPIIFIGESEDDWMNCKEVLNEIGQIYGAYFYQSGNNVIIENTLLYDLSNPVALDVDDYAADDTNITIQEAYQRIECSVDLSTIDETFIDPLDDEYMEPTTENCERVLTEIACKADDRMEDLFTFMDWCDRAVGNMTTHRSPVRDWSQMQNYYNSKTDPEVYDTYCQILRNNIFEFPTPNYLGAGHGSQTTDAWRTLQWLYNNPGKGAFVSFGRTEDIIVPGSNAEIKKPDMKNMLLIQVNGNRQESDYNSDPIEPQITANNPICSFTLNNSNNFVPNDSSTTNYLVIKGKIRLNPITPRVCPRTHYGIDRGTWGDSLDIHESEYTQPWLAWRMGSCSLNTTVNYWRNLIAEYNDTNIPFYMIPKNTFMIDRVTANNDDDDGFYYQWYTWQNVEEGIGQDPWTGGYTIYTWPYNQQPAPSNYIALPYLSPKFTKFKYAASSYTRGGDEVPKDNVKKVSILACELKIGDKYLVENMDSVATKVTGSINQLLYHDMFKWLTYDECPVKNGQKQTWFTIGVDPKIDDNLLGSELSITDTSAVWMNISEQGMCIPIYANSGLVGPVSFKILGPYNTTWDHNYKIKHGWLFWKHYTTGTENVPLLQFVENIQITELSLNLVSDKPQNEQNKDNDLVYYSYTNNRYQETKDFTCKFCTGLTSQDISDLQINYEPNNSTIIDLNNQTWYGMTYKGQSGVKLEEARVSEQYNMWKRPRNIVETTLKLESPELGYLKTNYTFDYLKYSDDSSQIYRTFNRTIDLKYDTMTCTMTELSDEPTNI